MILQGKLWYHRTLIDSLSSIVFVLFEDFAQNVNLFVRFILFRQLHFFMSCLFSYNYTIVHRSNE